MSGRYAQVSPRTGFLVRNGNVRRWHLRGRRRDFHWQRARKKFKLAGDDIYEDDALAAEKKAARKNPRK